ncbi:MAG: hypothetical protein ACJAVZ_002002 [Afipia broomeae]|jgi:hypothetical protein
MRKPGVAAGLLVDSVLSGVVGGRTVDTVVIEFDILGHGPPAVRSITVDEDDEAFPPLVGFDVFGIASGLHRKGRGGLGLLDRVRIGGGLDGAAVIRP